MQNITLFKPPVIVFLAAFMSFAAHYILDSPKLSSELNQTEQEKVSSILDQFHGAAAEADWDTYFDLMRDDAVFIGTDAAERWNKPTFQAYAAKAPNGWLYQMKERHIHFTDDLKTAWFDELLVNTSYGEARGTGVLIKNTEDQWQIAHYALTFPLPNELAGEITEKIQAFLATKNNN